MPKKTDDKKEKMKISVHKVHAFLIVIALLIVILTGRIGYIQFVQCEWLK